MKPKRHRGVEEVNLLVALLPMERACSVLVELSQFVCPALRTSGYLIWLIRTREVWENVFPRRNVVGGLVVLHSPPGLSAINISEIDAAWKELRFRASADNPSDTDGSENAEADARHKAELFWGPHEKLTLRLRQAAAMMSDCQQDRNRGLA
jgi:hypothetical protein